MKSLTYDFTNLDLNQFRDFIKSQQIVPHQEQTLVQAFCGFAKPEVIEQIQEAINRYLPRVQLIGTTTTGEIDENAISQQRILLHFSLFDATRIITNALPSSGELQLGKKITHQMRPIGPKALILFTDGHATNGDKLLAGIQDGLPKTTIAGGMAGDKSLQQTYVFTKDQTISHGAVFAALINPKLIVHTGQHMDWKPIGKVMTVTCAEENRVYEVDKISMQEIYQKYLGKELTDDLPHRGGLFPIIVHRDQVPICRSVLHKNPDGSLTFNGNINTGDKIQFGYGNAELILQSSRDLFMSLKDKPTQSIFVYSGPARKTFLGQSITREISPLNQLGSTAGFIGRGQFYQGPNGSELMNETMTVLTLSEDPEATHSELPEPENHTTDFIKNLNALSHLTQVVTEEMQEVTDNLEEKVDEQTAELQKSYDELKQLDDAKDEFISITSHELRTPLGIIKGYTSLLLTKFNHSLDEKQVEMLEKILKNASELNLLVKNILDLQKMNAGQFSIEGESSLVHAITQQTYEDFQVLAQKKNINLQLTDQSNLESTIPLSTTMFQQVLTNLLGNAIKFTPENGKISLNIQNPDQDHIEIAIQDTGIGIPKPEQENVFKKFHQTENILTRHEEGSGLGLAICKNIIEKTGGSITLESIPQQGSTFTIHIPLSNPIS